MSPQLKRNPQIWRLASDLGLKPKSDPLTAVVEYCLSRVKSILRGITYRTLSEALSIVATMLDTEFVDIHDDEELRRVKQEFLRKGETGFARLAEDLGPQVYAITYKRIARRKWERKFISVIDCRGEKRWRAYFSKWHEIAHLLTLTRQMRLKFCRTHVEADHKDPEEALMDVVAGTIGFFPELVAEYANGEPSFDKIRTLRDELCPNASFQASLIGFVQCWPSPCLLIQAGLGLRKVEKKELAQQSFGFKENPVPVLRALHVTSSQSARDSGLIIFRNMRVPKRSVIYRVAADGAGYLEAEENFSWWEASNGTRLPEQKVLVKAKSSWDGVQALIIPLD